MSEWWTYTLSDFLMFSAQTYYRLFEIYNREIWPAQILAIALGIVILTCLQRAGARQGRVVAAILAACWLWVAWAFQLERYATINWAARYFAIGFAVEALLLIWIGLIRGQLLFRTAANPIRLAGFYLLLFALALQPLIGPAIGRSGGRGCRPKSSALRPILPSSQRWASCCRCRAGPARYCCAFRYSGA